MFHRIVTKSSTILKISNCNRRFQGASVNVGELCVTYQIRLLKPKLFATLGEDIACYQSFNRNTYTNTLPLGNPANATFALSNNLSVVANSTSLTLPVSNVQETFLCYLAWQGSTAVSFVGTPIVTGINCVIVQSTLEIVPPVGTTIQGCCYSFVCKTNALGTIPVINFSTDKVLPSGSNNLAIRIFQIPNSVASLYFL